MDPKLKKRLIIAGVGVVAIAVLYFVGGDLDLGNAVKVLMSGDISVLCDQVENL